MSLPHDYAERVYAGVLGKIIGVYLGRPFEGWTYERICRELGEVSYYVHERFDTPLIVTDDDISGTFTFVRALADYANRRDLAPAQIGRTWLNYLIEERTILWWGGMGNSTEHTAYLRLRHGVEAPRSGSIALNGKVVAEQIGAQIFIDGWAMVAPGDPELAADLARRAACVSHDGEAIYGAQVLAAMESLAFVERDLNTLLDTAVRLIPRDSLIYALIHDLRDWHATGEDWHAGRARIEAKYGYDKYGGNCHIVPNHALIIHALLHGDDDFQKSLMIVNTCGWDTDCNSGNVGCLLGIKNGLTGIDGSPVDWRGPVADRMYLPTADGGRAITDAVRETFYLVNSGRALAGEAPLSPKDGARFHFDLPGAVQGFQVESGEDTAPAALENVAGHSAYPGSRTLALRYRGAEWGRPACAATPLFIPSRAVADYFQGRGYRLLASPQLFPGQTVSASIMADEGNAAPVKCGIYLGVYGQEDKLLPVEGPQARLAPGERTTLQWTIGDLGGAPIACVGIFAHNAGMSAAGNDGTFYLDTLTWDGEPDVTFRRTDDGGTMWRQAWVDGVSLYTHHWPEAFRIIQNEGRGLLMTGTREWSNYRVQATITPHMLKGGGIAARVQGMRRYYALLLWEGQRVRLVKMLDRETYLAESRFEWHPGVGYALELTAQGNRIRGYVDGRELFDLEDTDDPLENGGIALICEVGRLATEEVRVRPIE